MNTLQRGWYASILLLLSACGPGTGGTGSGDDAGHLLKVGASASPVCSAPWAAALKCSSAAASAPIVSANDPGTERLQFFSGSDPKVADLVLTFEGNRVTLTGGCPRLSFDGEWGITASGKSAFFGGYLDRTLVQPVTAEVNLTRLPDGSNLSPLQMTLHRVEDRQALLPVLRFAKSLTEVQLKPCP